MTRTPRKPLRKAERSLPVSLAGIPVAEAERARHGPVAGFRRHVEHERVGWIKRDGAQELHRRGPPSFGSSQEGAAKAFTRSLPL